ncbi:unnamed protein product [Clavelina lepadiformis]|uniref:VWFA domain-containing protein n=1 Tax=Clavelina lepadiformis TaxID=159417 RepID=A0ABP0GWZ3_CLALP
MVISVGITCFCLTVAVSFANSQSFDFSTDCISWGTLITNSVLTASVSYFADHPRNEEKAIDPEVIKPLTPAKVFQAYYGDGASSSEFKAAILDLVYAPSPENIKEDRNRIRKDIKWLANAGSSDLARTKMGTLIASVVKDFAGESQSWLQDKCLPYSASSDAYKAVGVEFARLRNEIGESRYAQFLGTGIGSTLAFVIDDTGSMSGEILAATKRSKNIIDHLQNSLDRPQDFVLAPFNDPEVGPLTATKDAKVFKKALDKLRAHGGGDQPELCLGGIQLALESSRPGSTLYVITDADAKDYKLQDSVIAEAKRKGTVITFMLTNDLSYCSRSSKDNYKTCINLYRHIANETGGKVLVVSRSAIFQATEIIQTGIKQGLVVVKKVRIVNGENRTIQFPVDHTMSEVIVEAQGNCGSLQVLHEKTSVSATPIGDLYSVSIAVDKQYGEWTVSLGGYSASCDMTISSKSTLGFLLTLGTGNSKDLANFKVLHSNPSPLDHLGLMLDFYGLESSSDFGPEYHSGAGSDTVSDFNKVANVRFLNEFGSDVLTPMPVKTEANQPIGSLRKYAAVEGMDSQDFDGLDSDSHQMTNGRFLNEFESESLTPTPENTEINQPIDTLRKFFPKGIGGKEPFYVAIEGIDSEGSPFTRVIPRLITTANTVVSCDLGNVVFYPGANVNVNITISNNGPNDTFVFGVSDTKGFAMKRGSSSKFIPSGGSTIFPIRLSAPTKAKDGESTSVTVTARGSQHGSFQYAVCNAVVGQRKRPRVDSLAIKGVINSRFAKTLVTSVVTNNADVGREAEFEVMLPTDAFIVNMTMKLDNETIVGKVHEKKKAKKVYDKAKKTGKAAGHVAVRDGSSRVYKTSLFVEPRKTVTFQLTYEQLLRRVKGSYKYAITLNPDQAIKKLAVDVHIVEENLLHFVRVSPFKTDQTSLRSSFEPPGTAITYSRDRRSSHVRYAPNITQQTEFSPFGLSGTFQVQYDVDRTQMYGDVTLANGYFAHFFAPPSLPAMPKMILFVVDISGSMFGHKITQMREALASVLRGLNKDDYFNLVFFNDNPKPWIRLIMSPATSASIDDAIEVLNQEKPTGGTNILAAFEAAFELMSPFLPELPPNATSSSSPLPPIGDVQNPSVERYTRLRRMASVTEADVKNYAKMMIFVTDGRASVGETQENTILERVTSLNRERMNIHTMGFGALAQMKLMEKIAARNGGFSRRIFESLDAAAQIEDYFEEVANPLMTDVTITYPDEKVQDLTTNRFSVFTAGSELVLAGRVNSELLNGGEQSLVRKRRQIVERGLIHGRVTGRTFENDIELDFDVDATSPSPHITTSQHQIQDFSERLWAFLKVKDLLRQTAIVDNATVKANINEQALNMSLKYNFVTPLTSLVVIRPKDLKRIEAELKKEEEARAKKEEEERKRLEEEEKERERLEEETAKKSFEHSRLFHAVSRKISEDVPSADLSYSGGFYGDPHFLIPIRQNLNLCFNWDGNEGSIYNFLHDPTTGMTVNGQLITTLSPDNGKKYRTYVSLLAIIIPSKKFKLLVDPEKITMIRRGARNFILSVRSSMTFSRDGIVLRAYDVSKKSAKVEVSVQGLKLQVAVVNIIVSRVMQQKSYCITPFFQHFASSEEYFDIVSDFG